MWRGQGLLSSVVPFVVSASQVKRGLVFTSAKPTSGRVLTTVKCVILDLDSKEVPIWVSKPGKASILDSEFLLKHSNSVVDPDPKLYNYQNPYSKLPDKSDPDQ